MANLILIENLQVEIDGKRILNGLDLEVGLGEVHVLMGPNGAGKSTLANVLMGHPSYEVVGGRIEFRGEDVTEMAPHERARLGLFLSFQYPQEIPGITLATLWTAKVLGKVSSRLLEFHSCCRKDVCP